jgi:hypothetical protein
MLFVVCYKEHPGDEVLEVARKLIGVEFKVTQETIKLESWQRLSQIYSAINYEDRNNSLNDHKGTIKLFNDTLVDRSQWPLDDCAEKQDIRSKNIATSTQITKSDWITVHDSKCT